jgi:CheY-like chemotaxis protein
MQDPTSMTPTANETFEVLLIEDTDADAELTMRALKKRGLANNLIWVKDGAEALDFLYARGTFSQRVSSTNPKVILLDLRLPRVSGLDVLKTIKSDERLKAIPVVVLTSSKDDMDVRECYRLGVNSYISKPVAFDDFTKVVADMGMYWLLMNKPPSA